VTTPAREVGRPKPYVRLGNVACFNTHSLGRHASPLQSGSIGETYECSALVGVLNELAHGERLS